MKYWDQMLSKHGFNDGAAVPIGIEHYREVYVAAINRLAAAHGSRCRIAPFDRAGLHNWCLILFVTPDWIPGRVDYVGCKGLADEAMEAAIMAAYDLDLDSYVIVKTKVDVKRLRACLKSAVSAGSVVPA